MTVQLRSLDPGPGSRADPSLLRALGELERRVLWLSTWMIHHANHVRENRDGLKVGGHQASSASLVSLMTALYFRLLSPEDRIAVKPHASPVLHAIEYLFGRQSREQLLRYRAMGGAQAYPSRTKDAFDVGFTTGSVGLGPATTLFASLARDYLALHGFPAAAGRAGRMVALIGDAELDEGNMFEAVLEGAKHDVRNLWWVIDYNRQSLDAVVSDERLFRRFDRIFEAMGWRVSLLKYGKRLEAAFARPGGEALREWIDRCPNSLYAALTFKAGASWRAHLRRDLSDVPGIRALLDEHDDEGLHALMTNLGGHDMETILEAFEAAVGDDRPHCFIAYTIKGHDLPLAGHKDNHAGLMSPAQMALFQQSQGIPPGAEWEPFAGLAPARAEALKAFIERAPRAGRLAAVAPRPRIAVPDDFPRAAAAQTSTQEAFGRIMSELARRDDAFAARIVTASPDVTVSTNLGPWVNRRGVFGREPRPDLFREERVVSAQRWSVSPTGQHIELGIAEHNLFLLLAALGLSAELFGERLLPVGTLYDPFIQRGLDALNYGCYTDARFMVVGTPAGLALAPEGGAHQSVATPLIGMGQPGLAAFEPAFADELAAVMRWGFAHMQAEDGGSVYLRLSTRRLDQPRRRLGVAEDEAITAGGYWLAEPEPGAPLAIVYCGAVAPEAIEAHRAVLEDVPGAGLLAVTSPDRLYAGWRAGGSERARSRVRHLLAPLAPEAALVTVLDGHPAALSWLGGVRGQKVYPLGVERFGQSGDIPDLFHAYGIDADGILRACARACLER